MKDLMNPRDDKWGIIQLQNCILNIAEYIDAFCEKSGIDYCLMGGSALGAIRHKGFIPWDDDLDIFMRPDQFMKFRECFKSDGDHHTYYLQEFGSSDGFPTMAKLRMNGTHYVEPDNESLNIHKGVFVDIFILHSCPDSLFGHLNQYLWSRYLVLKSLANRDYKRRGKLVSLLLRPLKWLPRMAFVNFALKQIYKHSAEKTHHYCHYLGRAGYTKGLYKSEYFSKTKKVPFERVFLRVPYRVEEYLVDRWGDYMKIPSEENIRYYQHSNGWEIKEPSTAPYQNGMYPDEKNLIV